MRSADDRGVITLGVTLGRTGHTPEPSQNRRPLDLTRVRSAGRGVVAADESGSPARWARASCPDRDGGLQ
jgi:hypothetical protein